ATIIVDAGGPVLPDRGWAFPSRDALNPQVQKEVNPNTGNAYSRTEKGVVLTQGIQTFLGQTNVIEWGKAPYKPGENGGISGMVAYAVTRAENDPRYGVVDGWEPGVPGVTVRLYESDSSGGILDRNGDGKITEADAVNTVTTDSWDASQPTACPGEPFSINGKLLDCYDGLRVYNQVRPGVYDGAYAFSQTASGEKLRNGFHVVEVVPPPGYEIVKEEDKNVDYGDTYVPNVLPPACVGDLHKVPDYLTMGTDAKGVPFSSQTGIEAPFKGQMRPLCDRKLVEVADGRNAMADFHLFTQVPIAAHMIGFILDDLGNEFDPRSPQFGEKHAPPYLPVSVRDWTGREIHRVHADQYGSFNALVPSTHTTNRPSPSGMSPNMLVACMNDPGPVLNPAT
ncbi:MAG: hypothetical protein K2Q10_02505, partial [Rhodospirillales bacterium]|nr:hypothetical protein [Rhodospirillales bacterium]